MVEENGEMTSIPSAKCRYHNELLRFKKIFKIPRDTLVLGVAGNHDIGFGDTSNLRLIVVVANAHLRHEKVFGKLNSLSIVANHSIIALDTIGLSGKNDDSANINANAFLNLLTTNELAPDDRRILISHVPLFRPIDSECGSRRRSGPIRNVRGYQYQNLIQYDLSNSILEKLKPSLIISGDDHDDCQYTHAHNGAKSFEVISDLTKHSIPTFSWLQGNIHPAFGVLSLRGTNSAPLTSDSPSNSLQICSLPPQMHIYGWYLAFLAVSILGTAYFARSRNQERNSLSHLRVTLQRLWEILYITIPCYCAILMFEYN